MIKRQNPSKLSKKKVQVITLDPSNLLEDEANLLHQFLLAEEKKSKDEKQKVFYQNTDYFFKGKTIRFTEQLVRRTKKQFFTKKYIYTVFNPILDNLLGKGSFGEVYSASGKLEHSNNSMKYSEYSGDKEKAIKVQFISPENKAKRMKKEYMLQKRIKSSKTKKITFEKVQGKKLKSYLLMRKYPGESLTEILLKKDTLTVSQRYHLTVNLMKALQAIFDDGVIPRDVKPDNIKVNLATMEVTVFDVGLGRLRDKKDKKRKGTPEFTSPEMALYGELADEKSDVYALGLILRELWDDSDRLNELIKVEDMNALEIITLRGEEFKENTIKNVTFTVEMVNKLNASGFDAPKLGDILCELTHAHPDTRLSLNDALKRIQKVPTWVERIEEIISGVEKNHFKNYDATKKAYVRNAIDLVRWAINNRNLLDLADDKEIADQVILKMFKVLMVCCFQNQNKKHFGLFNIHSIYTKTGSYIEKELRRTDYDVNDPNTVLREKLFGKNYGSGNILPSYHDMATILYQEQMSKYANVNDKSHSAKITVKGLEISPVSIELTPNNKIDVLSTASALITNAQPPKTPSIKLTVRHLRSDNQLAKFAQGQIHNNKK